MGVTECPFFPGKICYGTCPNNDYNIEAIKIEASILGVSSEFVRVARNLSFTRFMEAHATKIYNYEYYSECERKIVN